MAVDCLCDHPKVCQEALGLSFSKPKLHGFTVLLKSSFWILSFQSISRMQDLFIYFKIRIDNLFQKVFITQIFSRVLFESLVVWGIATQDVSRGVLGRASLRTMKEQDQTKA